MQLNPVQLHHLKPAQIRTAQFQSTQLRHQQLFPCKAAAPQEPPDPVLPRSVYLGPDSGPLHNSHHSTTPPPSKVTAPPDYPTNRRSGKALTAERDPLAERTLYPLNQLHHRSINTLDVQDIHLNQEKRSTPDPSTLATPIATVKRSKKKKPAAR
ncbi:hypothetical protein ACOSP7_032583 [Xanthoceras sorbifolium]